MSTILLIEDDQTISTAYKTVLSQEGYTVITALTGAEGTSILQKEHVDLILLDIMLPEGVNGFDVLRRVKMREETNSIPVIVLTNLDSEKQAALDYGASDYIVKSTMDVKQLVEKIKHILPNNAS